MFVNGHKIEQSEASEYHFEIDDGAAQFINVPGVGISGIAWDAEQKRIISEVMPNLEWHPKPNDDGLEVWKFYGKA